MGRIVKGHENLSIEQLVEFEEECNLNLPDLYKKFLLEWNGGYTEPSLFKISDEQGPSVLNVFYGIGDMYDNLEDFLEILDNRLPKGFIPIGDDPGGNVICLGTKKPYCENIFFWDHELEPEDSEDMSNMYFLANNIYEFIDKLYEDKEKED